jgi:hypothetical protein
MSRTLTRLRSPAGAALGAALALAASAAQAYPDAQVEAATRPRPGFGWLLNPPLWPGPPGPPGPPFPPGPPGPPILDRIVVDCTGWRPHMISRALRVLRPGGTLILRTHGGACIESVFISRPVQIVGDAGPAWFGGYTRLPFPRMRAVLVAPPGQPCITVAPGVPAVSLRGLVINAPGSGGSACIQARATDLEVRDSIIRYDGGGPAISVQGGVLRLTNLAIAARTPAPAVVAQGVGVNFQDVRIAATQIGMLLEPGPGESRLARVFARSLAGGVFDEAHPTTGLIVRGGADRSHVDVVDSVLLGFALGARR